MRDSHVKQFAGMLFGIGSIAFPTLALMPERGDSNSILFFIGIIIGAFFAGIILSAISIKLAKEYDDNKAKGMVGLITSIVGIASCLFMFFVIGLAVLIARQM